MKEYDVTILNKIIGYCDEIQKTHDFFKSDKNLSLILRKDLYIEIRLRCLFYKSEN